MIPELAEVQRSKEQIAAEIERLKKLPEKIRQEKLDQMNTLPPTDLVEHMIKENNFERSVTRGELENSKRAITRHTYTLLLLLFAAAAMAWWAYRSMERSGLL